VGPGYKKSPENIFESVEDLHKAVRMPQSAPMTSWADEIDDTEPMPRPSEQWVGNNKITTEFTTDEETDKRIKIVRTYKVEKKLVSKAIAKRKALPKFGMSRDHGPGPNPQTTVVTEEINMNFIANKEEADREPGEESLKDKLLKGGGNRGVVKCRICKEDHWTTNCPYKDTLGPMRDALAAGTGEKTEGEGEGPGGEGGADKDKAGGPGAAGGGGGAGGKYVPPGARSAGGGPRGGESMPERKRDQDTAAIRVSNLSENVVESDLQDLFRHFGTIARIYLAKDKMTNQCKGFAFINYYKKEDAAKAIQALNGYGYDHLILNVEWAKPPSS